MSTGMRNLATGKSKFSIHSLTWHLQLDLVATCAELVRQRVTTVRVGAYVPLLV